MSVWNPDASWERDDMLRVVMTMGVPTQVRTLHPPRPPPPPPPPPRLPHPRKGPYLSWPLSLPRRRRRCAGHCQQD